MRKVSTGSNVRYYGDLPEGWGPAGHVVLTEIDASGDQIATVEFGQGGTGGMLQDIPASELQLDPVDAQDYDENGDPV